MELPCLLTPCEESIKLRLEVEHLKESVDEHLTSLSADLKTCKLLLTGNGDVGLPEAVRDLRDSNKRRKTEIAEIKGLINGARRASWATASTVIGGVLLYVVKLLLGAGP